MSFCGNCGIEIGNNRFCPSCGKKNEFDEVKTTQEQSNRIEVERESDSVNMQPMHDVGEKARAVRQQEFLGKIIKCPSCGAEVSSVTAICPSCQHELNSTSLNDSVGQFEKEIARLESERSESTEVPKKGWQSWSSGQKIGWIILNLLMICVPLVIYISFRKMMIDVKPQLSSVEEQEYSFISNYRFPNERGAILEALLYVSQKVTFLSGNPSNNNNYFWLKVWQQKGEELFQKAEMLFPGDKVAKQAFDSINLGAEKAENARNKRFIFAILIVIVYIAFLAAVYFMDLNKDRTVKYDWNDSSYTEIIPKPESEYGAVNRESLSEFYMEVYDVSYADFEKYVEKCKQAGFEKSVRESDSTYHASNSDKIDIDVSYRTSVKEMTIKVSK